jgi:hypothetical protein
MFQHKQLFFLPFLTAGSLVWPLAAALQSYQFHVVFHQSYQFFPNIDAKRI